MTRLRIGVLDLVYKAPNRSLYARVNAPNLASIMPQAVAAWCERAGHEVRFVCYTGREEILEELSTDLDLLFIGAFTQAGQLAYALSNLFRSHGTVTVLGGPHARCYPDDARKYFDYVLGFTDEAIISDVLRDCVPHRPLGVHLSADRQPDRLPGVRERWKYIEPTLAKALTRLRGAPMLGSLGCPYTCSFCIDSTVAHRPVPSEQIREDLRFLLEETSVRWVAWHDPNFGVRFEECLTAIEEADRSREISHVAESSLSLLSEPRLKRLRDAGFKALLPGIESWYTLGNKSRTRSTIGMAKVERVAEHVNLILRYIPYVQTNFVLGLDVDEGAEPFELTKRFLDRTPGAFPGFSLLSAFGEAAPLNLEFQREDRVLGFPFHFLNNNHAMNVRPKNYAWNEFYDLVIDLTKYSFSRRSIARRAAGTQLGFSTFMNLIRAISSEGFGRIRYYSELRARLETDRALREYFEGETEEIPSFYVERVRAELGPFWEWLPEGALRHDPKAYLRKVNGSRPPEVLKAAAGAAS
ncbi:MAG: B12-binding domain-containing radical SAM protein [Gemmatimonadota bacterium]